MFKGRITEITKPAELHVSKVVDRTTVLREKCPVESFYIQEHENKFGKDNSVAIVDDVYMLFNQQRLDRMTSAALSKWLDSSSRSDARLASLRSRMSDAQLGSFIKSRYIQSRSELLAWSNYLEAQYPQVDAASAEPAAPAEPAPAPSASES